MKSNNDSKAVLGLDRAGLFLQLVAWHKLENDRLIARRFFLTWNTAEDLLWSRIAEKIVPISAKYPFMEIDERTWESLTMAELKELLIEAATFYKNGPDKDAVKKLLSGPLENCGGLSEICRQIIFELGGMIKPNSLLVIHSQDADLLCIEARQAATELTVLGANTKLLEILNFVLESDIKVFSDDGEFDVETVRNKTYGLLFADLSMSPDCYDTIWGVFEQWNAIRKIVLVPNEFLNWSKSDDPTLRRDFLLSGELEAVIALPGSILGSKKPDSSLLIFNKQKLKTEREKVCLIDEAFWNSSIDSGMSAQMVAQELRVWFHAIPKEHDRKNTIMERSKKVGQYVQKISVNRIRDNDYCLSPSFYRRLKQEASTFTFLKAINSKPLKQVAKFIRAQSVHEFQLLGEGKKFFEVTASDIGDDGFVKCPRIEVELLPFAFQRRKLLSRGKHGVAHSLGDDNGMLLEQYDILLTIKGNLGKVGLVADKIDSNWFPNQSILILRLKKGEGLISPIVLFGFLNSILGQTQLKVKAEESGGKFMKLRDLQTIQVPIPTVKNQEEIVSRFSKASEIYKKIDDLQLKARQVTGDAYEIFR